MIIILFFTREYILLFVERTVFIDVLGKEVLYKDSIVLLVLFINIRFGRRINNIKISIYDIYIINLAAINFVFFPY